MIESQSTPWRRASVSVNPDALSHNLNLVREYAPNCQVMAVIKSNAYGHGMLEVAEHLAAADIFAVAMPQEAFALRDAGCDKPLVVLHGFNNTQELDQFAALNISTVVHQRSQLDILLKHEISSAIDAWLKVDTGMHRLGISVGEVDEFFGQLRNCEQVNDVYLMSHFANADDLNSKLNINQLESFINVTNDVDVNCSMANSAAIMGIPKSHFEIVRPGIMLYGSSPFSGTSAVELKLQPAMQFESILIDIKPVKAGEAIGYGSTFSSDKDLTVGIVAVGYGDGYPRHANNGTPVWVSGERCALLGRVSMDSICIDLSDVDVKIGDRVVLWGNELSVDDVAAASNSIAYELLCNAGAAYGSNR